MNAVPTIQYDEDEARDACIAYIAILTQQKLDPSLVDNPAWAKLRNAAYANFYCSYEVIQ